MKFTIKLAPVAKERSRLTMKNGKTWSYTPHKTAIFEASVRAMISNELSKPNSIKPYPPDVPIYIGVIFYREKAKNTKCKCELPIIRPDVENYGKSLCDALNGLLWHDDSQITTMTYKKKWQLSDKEPCIEVTILQDKDWGNVKNDSK